MEFSIIVPVYNAEQTLSCCLGAIFQSDYKNFEVIVVDDGSCDQSRQIAEQFPVKIVGGGKNLGSSSARNLGATKAQGDFLVFIDSDVAVAKDSLRLIRNSFRHHSEVSAVIGCFGRQHPNKDFFSQYKNLYMYFIFSKLSQNVDFLFTSICAVKKNIGLWFNPARRKAVDTELGKRYKVAGKKILFNESLQVVHLKKYSFLSFIKNDFIIAREWVKILLEYREFKGIARQGRFAHARLNQILSIVISPLIVIVIIGSTFWFQVGLAIIPLILFFLVLNYKFFTFLCRERGLMFAARAVAITYLDMLVMGSGILSGFIIYANRKQ